MKKIFFLFLAIIGLSLTSCSTDEPIGGQTVATEKTNVFLNVVAPAPVTEPNKAGKSIARGVIPAPVKTISISAKNISSNAVVTSTWDVVDQNASEAFIKLSNIETGNTKFTITTTTDATQFKELTNFGVNGATPELRFNQALNNINQQVPYAIYNGETSKVIKATEINEVSAQMTTEHGRILTVFQLKDYLKNHVDSKDGQGFQAKITATVTGEASQTAITKKNEAVTFKWSNATSLGGKKVTYKVEIASINDQNNVLETYTITQEIVASTSLSCFYELDFKDFTFTKKQDVGINLSWQEWKNAHCSTGDCFK